MAEFDSKVVSFQRNASYLHERAIKNKKNGREADALELMRQAVSREPENARYQMDLAALMSEMGLSEQAYRILATLLSADAPSADTLYSMGVMQFHLGNVSRAERLLRTYTEFGGDREAEARRMLDEIMIAREANRYDRRTMRAMRCVDRACRMMSAGDHAGSERMFSLAMRMNDSAPEVHALRAMNMHMSGDDGKAMEEMDASVRKAEQLDSGLMRSLCICAQILVGMGKRGQAIEKLKRALSMEAEENDERLLLNAMFEAGLHDEIYDMLKRMLARAPHDKMLLHALSVSAYYKKLDADEIAAGWLRIQRLDPADPVCRYYLRLTEGGYAGEISYAYRFPAEEMARRAKVIIDEMLAGDERLKSAWQDNKEFREIIKWEIYQPDSRFTRLALSALMGVDLPETRKMLSVYAERPDVPIGLRSYVVQIASFSGRGLDKTLPDVFLTAGMPSEEEAMDTLSVGEKQMIRYAAEYVEDKYRDFPVADIALIWRAFVDKRGTLGVSMVSSEAGSAALAMCYLNMRGCDDDIYTVSRWYACSPRQAAYIAKMIRNSINNAEEA